ncbi:MAG: ArsA family ATPase [Acidimicrobiales bacterium]
MSPPGLADLVAERSIVICCGSGGAGKTTVSAAIALAGAEAGRSTCVVTIDPARRLADALGLGSLDNVPRRIEGPFPGSLHAVMLDAKGTFDDLVRTYAAGDDQAERILSNRLYRNLTSALSGTQEYMAAEKLYELNASGEFDLVVVDTPPTRNALDFLDAPGRLTRFLENRVFRLLLMPTRASLRALTLATQTLLRTISKVAGSEIVDDAVAFFRAFEGMESGFSERAERVEQLLGDPGTAFVLVAAPRRDSVAESGFFADRLAEAHQPVSALVINRLHPRFDQLGASAAVEQVGGRDGEGGGEGLSKEEAAGVLADLRRNYAELESLAEREEGLVAAIGDKVAGPVVRVPFLDEDVHDLAGLGIVAGYLVGGLRRADDLAERPESADPPEGR